MCVPNSPETKRIFLAAQLSLLVFSLLAVPIRLYPKFHPDLMDGARGLFLGITLATLFVAFRRKARAAG
jgi:hypothetical protein